MHGCCPGLNRTDYAPGNLLRFELVFRLTSSYDENYFHVHTLKASAVSRDCCSAASLCMHI